MEDRALRQRLASALGLTLKDGSPIIVGSPKCPPDRKIVAALIERGWQVTRLTNAQRDDRREDTGYDGRHGSDTTRLSPEIRQLLDCPSGLRDCGGDLTLEDHLLLGM